MNGRELRRIRSAAGYDLQQFSRVTGVARQKLSKLEQIDGDIPDVVARYTRWVASSPSDAVTVTGRKVGEQFAVVLRFRDAKNEECREIILPINHRTLSSVQRAARDFASLHGYRFDPTATVDI